MRREIPRQRRGALHRFCQRRRVLLVGEKLDPVRGEDRRLWWQRPVFFVLGGQLSRRDLAGFHVGLIERVDAKDGARYRGRELPAEELLSQVVRIVHRDADDRVTRALQLVYGCVLRRVGCRHQSYVDENAIATVDIRLSRPLRDRSGSRPCRPSRWTLQRAAPARRRDSKSPATR